ncbi:hypothetical protein U0070_019017, partial [Myodes glareolus]
EDTAAHSNSPQALRQFGNEIKCTIPGSHLSLKYNNYGCHCGLDSSDTWVDNLDSDQLPSHLPFQPQTHSHSCSHSCSKAKTSAPKVRPALPLSRCCQTQDQGYSQVMHVKSCKFLLDNPYPSSYNIHALGMMSPAGVEKNNACEDLLYICNSYYQAAICFSKAPYIKKYRGHHC